jgi:hypothetical protein
MGELWKLPNIGKVPIDLKTDLKEFYQNFK